MKGTYMLFSYGVCEIDFFHVGLPRILKTAIHALEFIFHYSDKQNLPVGTDPLSLQSAVPYSFLNFRYHLNR